MRNIPVKMLRNEGLARRKGKRSLFFPKCKRFECDVCGASLKSKWNLTVHMQTHGEPFECEICHMYFKYRHKLRAHMARHSGKISYDCNKCLASFGYHRDLRSHLNKCHIQIEHECHGCGALFDKASTFDNHLMLCINLRIPDVSRSLNGQERHNRRENSSVLQRVPIHKANTREKRNNQRQMSPIIKESSHDSNESKLHRTNSDIFHGGDYFISKKFYPAQKTSKNLTMDTPNHLVTTSEKQSNIFQQCGGVRKKKYCKLKKNLIERIESGSLDCSYHQKQDLGNKSREWPAFFEDHLPLRPTSPHQNRKGRKHSLRSKRNPMVEEKDADIISNIEKLLKRKSVIGRSNSLSVISDNTFTNTRANCRKSSGQDDLAKINISLRLNNIEMGSHHTKLLTDTRPSAAEEMKTPTSDRKGQNFSKSAVDVDAKDRKNINVSRKKYSAGHNSIDKDATCSKNINFLSIEKCNESNTKANFGSERSIDPEDSANINTSLTSSSVNVGPHHVAFFIDTEPCVAEEMMPTSTRKGLNFSGSFSEEENCCVDATEQNFSAKNGKTCSKNVLDLNAKDCKNITMSRIKYSANDNILRKKDETCSKNVIFQNVENIDVSKTDSLLKDSMNCNTLSRKAKICSENIVLDYENCGETLTVSGKGLSDIVKKRETSSENLTVLDGAKCNERKNVSRKRDSAKHDTSPMHSTTYSENGIGKEENNYVHQFVPSKGDSTDNVSPLKRGKTCSKTLIILDEEKCEENQTVSRKRDSYEDDISPRKGETCSEIIIVLDEEIKDENQALPKKKNSSDINTPLKKGETCIKTVVLDSNESQTVSGETAKYDTSAQKTKSCPEYIVQGEENCDSQSVPSKGNFTDNDSPSNRGKTCSKTIIILDEENCEKNQTVLRKRDSSEHSILARKQKPSFDKTVLHEENRTESHIVLRKRKSTDNESPSKRGKTCFKTIICLDEENCDKNQTVSRNRTSTYNESPSKRGEIDNDSSSKIGKTDNDSPTKRKEISSKTIICLDEENCDENQTVSKNRTSTDNESPSKRGEIDNDRSSKRGKTDNDSPTKRKEICSKTTICLDEENCDKNQTVSRKRSTDNDSSSKREETYSIPIIFLDEENCDENHIQSRKRHSSKQTLSRKAKPCFENIVLDEEKRNENQTVPRKSTGNDNLSKRRETWSKSIIFLDEENCAETQTVSRKQETSEGDILSRKGKTCSEDIIILDEENTDKNQTFFKNGNSTDINTLSKKVETYTESIVLDSNENGTVSRQRETAKCDTSAQKGETSLEDIIVLNENINKNQTVSVKSDSVKHNTSCKKVDTYSKNVQDAEDRDGDQMMSRRKNSSDIDTGKSENLYKKSSGQNGENINERQSLVRRKESVKCDAKAGKFKISEDIIVLDEEYRESPRESLEHVNLGRKLENDSENIILDEKNCEENGVVLRIKDSSEYGTSGRKGETCSKDDDICNENQMSTITQCSNEEYTLVRKEKISSKTISVNDSNRVNQTAPVTQCSSKHNCSGKKDKTCSKNVIFPNTDTCNDRHLISRDEDSVNSRTLGRKIETCPPNATFLNEVHCDTSQTGSKKRKSTDTLARKSQTCPQNVINDEGCHDTQISTRKKILTESYEGDQTCSETFRFPESSICGENNFVSEKEDLSSETLKSVKKKACKRKRKKKNKGQRKSQETDKFSIPLPTVLTLKKTKNNLDEKALKIAQRWKTIFNIALNEVKWKGCNSGQGNTNLIVKEEVVSGDETDNPTPNILAKQDLTDQRNVVQQNKAEVTERRVRPNIQPRRHNIEEKALSKEGVSPRISESLLKQVNHGTGKSKSRESNRNGSEAHKDQSKQASILHEACVSTRDSEPSLEHVNGNRKRKEIVRNKCPVQKDDSEYSNTILNDGASTRISEPLQYQENHFNGERYKRESKKKRSARNGKPAYKDHSEQDVEAALQDMVQWLKRENTESDLDIPVPGDIQEKEDISEKCESSTQGTCVPWLSLEASHYNRTDSAFDKQHKHSQQHSWLSLSQTGLEDMIAWVKREESLNDGRESPDLSNSIDKHWEMISSNDNDSYMPLLMNGETLSHSEVTYKFQEIKEENEAETPGTTIKMETLVNTCVDFSEEIEIKEEPLTMDADL